MDRVRVAIAVLLHLLAASTEMAGHQQPAAPPPATDDQDAAIMAGKCLWFVAVHHLSTVSSPLPWVASGPGADGTTSNSQEDLAMQAAWSALPPVLPPVLNDHEEPWFKSHYVLEFDLSTGSHSYNDCLQRDKWSRLSYALLVAEKEGAVQVAVNILDVLLRPTAGVTPAPATKKATGVKSLDTDNCKTMNMLEALDILDVLLRHTAATKRAMGKSLDTDDCNTKNRLGLHAMKGGRKILPDSVNGTTTQSHVTKMDEKNGSTKLKGAARKMAIA